MPILWKAAIHAASATVPGNKLAILIFHRVLSEPDPLMPSEPSTAEFDRLCDRLKSVYRIFSLTEAVHRLNTNSLPPRSACITFDDGYRDNHDNAMPVLRKHGLTADFFISTGFLDGGMMWNDRILEAIRQTQSDDIDVTAFGLSRYDLRTAQAKIAAANTILTALKHLPFDAREIKATEILDRAGGPRNTLMMTPEQVKNMRANGMEIGAHSVRHPILHVLSEAEARTEILQSKATLEQILGEPVKVFAYPNGKPGLDYSSRDVAIVREAGFDIAVSTHIGTTTASTPRLELPRYTPWRRGTTGFFSQLTRNYFAAPRAPA